MTSIRYKVGDVINKRYEVLKVVGSGGMGTVLKVRRSEDGKDFALKLCHLSDDESVRRFKREVRIMKKIDHVHVINVERTGLKHDPPYFVMPFAESSIANEIDHLASDHARALRLFLELCRGIQAIHNADAVHRDIKPDNALVVNGKVVVSDLGLAKMNERDTTILTQTTAVVGTMMYLAPEQSLGGGSRDADARTDIFQLGKTLYEMLTGAEPVLMDFDKPPGGIAHVVRKATQIHPDERYQTVGQLIDAVEAYRRAQDPETDPVRAFESVVERIEEGVEWQRYDEGDFDELLTLLSLDVVQEDDEAFIELCDQIPDAALRVMAETKPDEVVPILSRYVYALDQEVGQMPFSYAETVAARMKLIVLGGKVNPVIKAAALEAALISAVRLNRFAAIDTVNVMLMSIDDAGVAGEVRDMLSRRRREYESIADAIPAVKLHSLIRTVRDELSEE